MDLRKLTRALKGAAGGARINVSHPTHVVVARNVGGEGRHTSARSSQHVRIVQDGRETREESTTESAVDEG